MSRSRFSLGFSLGGRRDGGFSGLSRPQARDRSFGHWLGWLALAMQAISTRRHLAEMDGRMLKDIGLSRSEAMAEAARAPWDFGPTRPQR